MSSDETTKTEAVAENSAAAPAKRHRPVLVQMETPNLVPERELGKMPVLQAEHLGIDFGGLTAVDDFNIAMGRTEISGLIGPNGAGKTTIFNLLTNVYKPTRGTILLDGYDTAGKSVVEVNKMTVEENVLVGLGNSMSTHLFTDVFRLPKHWKQEAEFHDKAMDTSVPATSRTGPSADSRFCVRLPPTPRSCSSTSLRPA